MRRDGEKGSEEELNRERVDGLSAIARRLGRSVPTVRKWYKQRGLPLYKEDVSARNPRYYAYAEELEHWKRKSEHSQLLGFETKGELAREKQPSAGAVPSAGVRRAPLLPRWIVFLAPLALLACLGVALSIGTTRTRPSPKELEPLPSPLWIPLEDEPAEPPISQRMWDLNQIKPAQKTAAFVFPGIEVVVAIPRGEEERYRDNRWLRFLDPKTGTVVLSPAAMKVPHFFDNDYSRTYGVASVDAHDFDGDGFDEIIVVYSHSPNDATFSVLYEPTMGRSRILYASRGHHFLSLIADLDGDGSEEVLFHGSGNEVAWFESLVAVDLHPGVGEEGTHSSPVHGPSLDLSQASEGVFLALLRPTSCDKRSRCASWDPDRQLLVLSGETPRLLDRGGFLLEDRSLLGVTERQELRRSSWTLVREARALADKAEYAAALDKLDAARGAASQSGDVALGQWVAIQRLRALAGFDSQQSVERELREYEARYGGGGINPYFEIAEASHLSGRLDVAARWYRQALVKHPLLSSGGRPQWESLRGLVLVLCEAGQSSQAVEELERYADSNSDWPEILSKWLLWREGQLVAPTGQEMEHSHSDWFRYFELEYRFRWDGGKGLEVRVLEEIERSSRSRPLLAGLRAQLLVPERPAEAAALLKESHRFARRLARRDVVVRAHLPLLRERCIAAALKIAGPFERLKLRLGISTGGCGPRP